MHVHTSNEGMHILPAVLTLSFLSSLIFLSRIRPVAAQLASQTFENGLISSNNFSIYADYYPVLNCSIRTIGIKWSLAVLVELFL